ncbi:MAG: DUF6726 family protein [Planctomycetota bacterium]
MRKIVILALLCGLPCLSGCFLTKILTVPMRTAGAAVSVIPVAGNKIHDAIDTAAEVVDEIPI